MRQRSRLLIMDPASAEMTKYAANTMLATRISFMNEISALCEKIGADIELVRQGLGSDSRIGSAFLFPGVGYGGACFPKDIRALVHTGSEHGVEMTIAKSVQQVNINQQERFARRIMDYFKGRESKTTLAVWDRLMATWCSNPCSHIWRKSACKSGMWATPEPPNVFRGSSVSSPCPR